MDNTNTKSIVWNKAAINQFNDAIAYIEQDSFQNAQKVKAILLLQINKLRHYPEIYPLDKYKQNNDGYYRAFEKFHLRVSYYISPAQVRILRIRHTKRKPLKY